MAVTGKIIILFSIFLACYYCGNAQIDSSYIEPYEQKLSIQVYMAKDLLVLNQEIDAETEKSFVPNNPPNIGLGISVRNTIINFQYGYGFDFMRNKKQGKTKSFDLQLHNYGQKFVFDVFFQKYKGFYNDEPELVLYPDLKVQLIGANAQYVFNNKKFSYKAAFNQSARQIKSAGSWLAGVGVSFTKIESDSSLILNNKHLFNNFQFGISGGYAYTHSFNRHWFVSGSVTVGINLGSEKFSTLFKQKLEVYPSVFPRLAVGYNRDSWSLGFSFLCNVVFPSMSDNEGLMLVSGVGNITFTKRFNW